MKTSKHGWVMKQPRTLSAKEVSERAAKAGLTISPSHVYTIRSTARRAKNGHAEKHAKTAAKRTNGHANGNTTDAQKIAALVLELGTSRLIELVGNLRG